MEAADVRGRFVWHELMTRDVPAAKKFYSKLVGWKTLPWPLDPSYTVCHADAGPMAGMMQIPADMPAEVPAHWVNYIGTRDVDGTADAAVSAGGSVIKAPDNMPGAGRYAVLQDPQGAVFAIIDPENARPEAAGRPPPGGFSWHELATSDYEAAFAFYSDLFGWEAMQRMDMGPTGVYLIFGQNGVQRGGMYIKPADMPAPPNWLPYACVPDADQGFTLAISTGGRELQAPMDVPGGSRIAVILDPTGAAFAIHSEPLVAVAASKPRPKSAPKPKAKPKTKARIKTKARPKVKAKAKAKSRPVRKPVARKKVVRKAGQSAAKKAARKPASKKSKSSVRRKK